MTTQTSRLRSGISAAAEDLGALYQTLRTHRLLAASADDKRNALRYELAAADVNEIRERLQGLQAEVVPDADTLAAAETRPCETSMEEEAEPRQ